MIVLSPGFSLPSVRVMFCQDHAAIRAVCLLAPSRMLACMHAGHLRDDRAAVTSEHICYGPKKECHFLRVKQSNKNS